MVTVWPSTSIVSSITAATFAFAFGLDAAGSPDVDVESVSVLELLSLPAATATGGTDAATGGNSNSSAPPLAGNAPQGEGEKDIDGLRFNLLGKGSSL